MKKKLEIFTDEEKLVCSLISKYPYSDVKDVITEACLHQMGKDFLTITRQSKGVKALIILQWLGVFALGLLLAYVLVKAAMVM